MIKISYTSQLTIDFDLFQNHSRNCKYIDNTRPDCFQIGKKALKEEKKEGERQKGTSVLN